MTSEWNGTGRRSMDRERRTWKDVMIGILASVIITSSVGWFSYVKDAPRKDDVHQLQMAVDDLAKTVADLKTSVAVLADHVGAGAIVGQAPHQP